MLVTLYIISAVAGVMVSVFENQEKFKEQLISALIAIISGFAFCIPMLVNIVSNSTLDFWPLFAVLFLIAWQFAFLRNDVENLPGYELCILITTMLLCLFCYTHFDYIVRCSEEHTSTEMVSLITTVDGTESGKSIYGDGFVVGLINDTASNKQIYQYYYRSEYGRILPVEIDGNCVTINYIGTNISPYVEITSTKDCFGYTLQAKRHIFIVTTRTYNLYIPEGSIKNLSPLGSN